MLFLSNLGEVHISGPLSWCYKYYNRWSNKSAHKKRKHSNWISGMNVFTFPLYKLKFHVISDFVVAYTEVHNLILKIFSLQPIIKFWQ